MAQIQKLKVATEVKCSADQFYDLIRNNMQDLVKIFPQVYKSIDVLERDGHSVDSIILLKYFIGGSKVLVAKERIVDVDDENRSMTFKVIEGDVLSIYASFTFKLQITTKGNGAVVEWCLEYEKAKEDAPTPNAYADLLANLTKELDPRLLLKA